MIPRRRLIDANSRDRDMNSDIVGRRYVATGAPSTVWVVSDEVRTDMEVPHVRLLKSDDPSTTKLIAVSALEDNRLYRIFE